ncbi:MAG: hypothetical protein AAB415_03375 [Patescibacteria group bacterium]
MFLIIVIALLVTSFLIMVVLALTPNRSPLPSVNLSPAAQSASEVLAPVIAATAYGLIAMTRRLVKFFSIHFLVAVHALVSLGHVILTRIEKRFALLIDAVRGRGQTPSDRHRGSVSFFLEQIKDYKEEMTRQTDLRP